MPPPVLWSAPHVVALVATCAAAIGVARLARGDPARRIAHILRYGLAFGLLSVTVAVFVVNVRDGGYRWMDLLPLHLCDMAIFVAIYSLLTLRRFAVEVLYFWAATGTALAVLTPDPGVAYPDVRFIGFFASHAGVIAAASLLVFGMGQRPRRGAPWRVFLLTNAYAAGVGGVNAAFGTNYLYLRAKPDVPTLLDAFGTWPWYIVVADVLALALFLLLALPLRSRGESRLKSP